MFHRFCSRSSRQHRGTLVPVMSWDRRVQQIFLRLFPYLFDILEQLLEILKCFTSTRADNIKGWIYRDFRINLSSCPQQLSRQMQGWAQQIASYTTASRLREVRILLNHEIKDREYALEFCRIIVAFLVLFLFPGVPYTLPLLLIGAILFSIQTYIFGIPSLKTYSYILDLAEEYRKRMNR